MWMTAKLDLGDKHGHRYLLDALSGEMVEQARARTITEAFERRCCGCESTRLAIETGTHSPWEGHVARL
jgi:hypothetical protein